jgi:hypothetical protein
VGRGRDMKRGMYKRESCEIKRKKNERKREN